MSWPKRPDAWSTDELDRLRAAVARFGADWPRVAACLEGRSIAACKQAYNTHERQRKLDQAAPSIAHSPKRLKSWQDKRARERAAEEERARAARQARSVTSEVFGDPLPGRSALDRKTAGMDDPAGFDRRQVQLPRKPTLFTGGQA